MRRIRRYEYRPLEEDLLALARRDLEAFPILVDVAGIPIKAGACSEFLGKLVHGQKYILVIYSRQAQDTLSGIPSSIAVTLDPLTLTRDVEIAPPRSSLE
jgi:hypothetical protein